MRVQHIHCAFVSLVCLLLKVLLSNRNHPHYGLSKGIFRHKNLEGLMELLSDGAASGAEQGTGALLSPVQVTVQDTSVAVPGPGLTAAGAGAA